jgi:hypothetical protein
VGAAVEDEVEQALGGAALLVTDGHPTMIADAGTAREMKMPPE